ncbi:Domain of unknown function DUF362 [Acididesulfobacillus acetoxydans]|uniref:DUF362 domain-containing protein n=1 Tax=Acididesulfobacillus acetoxydans TaxID=1561005 RepID=A0A8S0WFN9_9FIRM|nr:DUF362 domain-containing protein [Acididesulfobacillus acetoxydans]CAA7601222.1 Domain of unknown function DUF362 [Acididesulfobacillus acetoxydans]CEJ08499.1 Domain of unknown function (DUF362) [Acididesulfobacillus acetoxydans]
MMKPRVSLVKFQDPYESVRSVIELCDGLAGLKRDDKILIKPNIVSWDFDLPFPPYGVVTTTTVMQALVRVLKEAGFDHLTIGEAPLPNIQVKDKSIFETIGYDKLAKRYGVRLVDFNQEKFEEVDFGSFKLSLAKSVLAADKIINVPVLKTHNQAKVSLGIKNLKGVLNRKSKMFCHGTGEFDLLLTFPRIIEKLPVALTLIDGVYTLEKGPGPTGKAYRKNLLIASRDALACDLVGANVLGYKGEDVPYLRDFAARAGYGLNLGDIDIRGEDVETQREFVDYDWEWTEDDTGPAGFKKRGIGGLAIRKYDNSLCTGCSMQYNPMLILLSSAYKGVPFPNVELVSGKQQMAAAGFEHTILFGHCAVALNQGNSRIKHAIAVKGCPPDMKQFAEILRGEGIVVDEAEYIKYRHYIFNRYKGKEEFDLDHWTL